MLTGITLKCQTCLIAAIGACLNARPFYLFRMYRDKRQNRYVTGYTEKSELIPYLTALALIYHFLLPQDTIMKYNSDLAEWAADMLSKAWGSKKLVLPEGMRCPGMHCIALPDNEITQSYIDSCDGGTCIDLMFALQDKHGVNCGIKLFMGKLWARISVHVYHHEEDFYKLRDAMIALLKLDS